MATTETDNEIAQITEENLKEMYESDEVKLTMEGVYYAKQLRPSDHGSWSFCSYEEKTLEEMNRIEDATNKVKKKLPDFTRWQDDIEKSVDMLYRQQQLRKEYLHCLISEMLDDAPEDWKCKVVMADKRGIEAFKHPTDKMKKMHEVTWKL